MSERPDELLPSYRRTNFIARLARQSHRRLHLPSWLNITSLTTRTFFALSLTMLTLVAMQACGDSASDQGALQAEVVTALDDLAADLVADRPADATAYAARLQAYMESHPGFFGSAAVLLDPSGAIIAMPYVYRATDGYSTKDLATAPSYDIESQDWFTKPLSANAGVWLDPFFDAGGGDIWMITRSVPVRDTVGIFAIITTDLAVDPPTQ